MIKVKNIHISHVKVEERFLITVQSLSFSLIVLMYKDKQQWIFKDQRLIVLRGLTG